MQPGISVQNCIVSLQMLAWCRARRSGGIAVSHENAVALHWYTREFFSLLVKIPSSREQ